MEENEIKNDVQITDEVIAIIAGIAIKDVEGVVKVATSFASGITEALGKKNAGKGVKVEVNNKEVKIDIGIIVEYGVKMQEIAKNIQDKITNDVETMTGYKVNSVNVKIQGIETKNQVEDNNIVEDEKANNSKEN